MYFRTEKNYVPTSKSGEVKKISYKRTLSLSELNLM